MCSWIFEVAIQVRAEKDGLKAQQTVKTCTRNLTDLMDVCSAETGSGSRRMQKRATKFGLVGHTYVAAVHPAIKYRDGYFPLVCLPHT